MKGSKILRIFFWSLLLCFTLYVALDTFVISRVYTPVSVEITAAEAPSPISPQSETAAASVSAETAEDTELTLPADAEELGSYSDENIRIRVYSSRVKDTTCYIADVQLTTAEYLKTALAQGSYGKNVTEKTSEIADDVGAILAVNGDYYGAQETGYVIRNGVLYRDTAGSDRQDLVIYADGSMEAVSEAEVSAQTLLENGAQQVLSFGPALVENGEIVVTEEDEVGKAMVSNPRTAIGWVSWTHYVFFVSDGRTEESAGLTLYEEAELLQSIGCTLAYNLDGGGSSTMVFQGKVLNNPTTNGDRIKERQVSDIVYIG